jgi:immune inhibitor A
MFEHAYEWGPTTCVANPKVLKSIMKQLKASKALSRGDVRLAVAMGLVTADSLSQPGFNDGVFYPPTEGPVVLGALRAGVATAARAVAPRALTRRASTSGTLHALALLVDFSDNVGTRPASDFAKLLFDAGDPASMTSIYRDLSRGALTVTGEAIGYVRAPQPYSYYTGGKSGMGTTFPNNTPGLLQDALTEFCKKDSLTRFDTDGDGYVDGIFLIHAGKGAEAEPVASKRPDMIWSHKWTLPTPFTNKGVKVYAYSTEPEDGRVGVFSHEFGHVLGLPDLYDTSYRSSGVGNWCLMGGGSWGGGGNTPTRMSCWCLSQLGWIKPKVVKAASALTLSTLEADPSACYRLWTGGKTGTEYFLVENRQPTGRDVSVPGSGLAVWHIDETQTGNTNPLAYEVGLVQADGKRDLEFGRNQGDAGDLFPGSAGVKAISDSSTPSTRANDGTATGVALSSITEAGGVVKVRVKV